MNINRLLIIIILFFLNIINSFSSTFPSSTQIYDLIKLNSTSALCLDGSNAGYYLSQTGDINKILLYFQGGGWCYGEDDKSTIQNCHDRSLSYLGSSKYYSNLKIMNKGIHSNHKDNYFKDWKRVYIQYCDGAGYQGSRKQPINYKGNKLYFRGHNITTQILEDLQNKIQLFSKAKQVVISGISAGGVAVFHWTNYIVQRIKNGKVWSFADSAVFLDELNPKQNKKVFRELLSNTIRFANEEVDIPVPECVAANKQVKINCFFIENLYQYLKAPLFLSQSLYDTWSLKYILGMECLPFLRKNTTLISCNVEQLKIIQFYHLNTINFLQKIIQKQENAVWGLACINHGYIDLDIFYDIEYRIPKGSQYSISQSVGRWIEDRLQVNGIKNNSLIQMESWPKNTPCSGVRQSKMMMIQDSIKQIIIVIIIGLSLVLIVVLGLLFIGKWIHNTCKLHDGQKVQLLKMNHYKQ